MQYVAEYHKKKKCINVRCRHCGWLSTRWKLSIYSMKPSGNVPLLHFYNVLHSLTSAWDSSAEALHLWESGHDWRAAWGRNTERQTGSPSSPALQLWTGCDAWTPGEGRRENKGSILKKIHSMHISFFLLLFFTFLTIYHGSGEAHIREILKLHLCMPLKGLLGKYEG